MRTAICLLLVIVGSVNAAQPATKAIPAGVLVDVDGRKMGHFSPREDGVGEVLVSLNGTLVYIGAYFRPDGSRKFEPFGLYDDQIYYSSPNCTGQAYVYSALNPPVRRFTGDGSRAEVVLSSGPRVSVPHLSRSNSPGQCENVDNGNPMDLYPVSDIVNLESYFRVPYTLR